MNRNAPLPLVVILGTNEIASAVAVHLNRVGWRVILSHDPFPPVIRRGMAFHDVLFGDQIVIDGVEGVRAEATIKTAAALTNPDGVVVTALQLTDILTIRPLDVLVDARMQKHRVTPHLSGVARVTVGLGPLFRVGINCDIAVETKPACIGQVVTSGSTDAADGISNKLGGVGSERFVYSDRPGRWHTPVDIGSQIFARFVVGHLDGQPVHAPFDGIVRGIVRDGMQVPPSVKLVEIDPRGREARWTDIDDRGRSIAEATVKAIQFKFQHSAMAKTFETTLVH